MGSTGEADRKRRHLSSISSPTTPTANPKKQPFLSLSEDKKLDAAVLQYQNQQLVQKLEAQKVEYASLDNQFSMLKERQQPHDRTLSVVKKCWEELVSDLEACSTCARDSSCDKHCGSLSTADDGTSSSLKDVFLSRLIETGATETSSMINPDEKDEEREVVCTKIKNIISNVIAAIDQLWHLKDSYISAVLNGLPEDASCKQLRDDLKNDVRNLRGALNDLHLKHKSLVGELQNHCDTEAKDKAELKRLRGEVETTVAELEESNYKLASLKAEKDATKGAFFPVLSMESKSVSGDRVRDKQKDLQDMESRLKELLDQASARLLEIKGLQEDRKGILKKLSALQNTVKNVKCISSSQAYLLVRDQLSKSKAEVAHYQAIYEKLQAEKDNLAWREKEVNLKNELVDIFCRSSAVAEYRVKELGLEIQKVLDLRNAIQSRLEEAAREPGREEIISEFKAMVSSFPEDMSIMQLQLSKYKESASNVHSLRADVQSLSAVLDRKTKELRTLYTRSADQVTEMKKLQSTLQDLRVSYQEVSLILEMYRRESPETSVILEAMDLEYKALSHVQSLRSSLDEHNLELRVKKAIEAEAISQQRLAASEAEIADLRQTLEASNRDISNLSNVLKSKSEENEAYLAEIESIGQAYDDMQTQNQHLLQQITERDDYNIKLILEGVKARQLHDSLLVEKQSLEKETQRQNASLDFYNMKAGRIEDQLKLCSDQVQKLAEDRLQRSTILDNMQKRLLNVKRLSQQARDNIQGSQSKLDSSRLSLAEIHIELDKERFDRKRLEEELEAARRKISRLKAEREGSLIDKLQIELREYRELLKCGVCHDRAKEVVITKCYHLFCHQCIQRIIGIRHRKCPSCAASFSPNDVKPVYI